MHVVLAALLALPAGAETPLAVPDVPYVAQSGELCGGAALAMVLRYWGAPGVSAEQFAEAAGPGGVLARDMAGLAEARGFRAFAIAADRASAMAHLRQGRPLVALLSPEPGRHHYVVLLQWAEGRVLFHDPAVAPFGVMDERDWMAAWEGAGRWALLVLPMDVPSAGAAETAPHADACAELVQPAVARARGGDLDGATTLLAAAALACPRASSPWRELAGISFLRRDYARAARQAHEALGREPGDAAAWRLRAASLFLDGAPEAALEAWNTVGEPRLDLVQVDGLDRLPYRSVADPLGLAPGDMVTADLLRLARRRAEHLPSVAAARVSYRPLPGGRAHLDVAVVERSALPSRRLVLASTASRVVAEGALGADLTGTTAAGTWHAGGSWQPNRWRAELAAEAPWRASVLTAALGVRSGVWRRPDERGTPDLTPVVRRRASLGWDRWLDADWKVGFVAAADRLDGQGFMSLAGTAERRLLGDRLAVDGAGAGWWSPSSGPVFGGSIRARALVGGSRGPALRMDAAWDHFTRRAPLPLWAGAGTGDAGARPLRGHALVREGIVDGEAFGRSLLTASVEGEAPVGGIGPVRVGAAVFADTARVLAPVRSRLMVDLGAGVRLRLPGGFPALRVDVAWPWGGGRPRVSGGLTAGR